MLIKAIVVFMLLAIVASLVSAMVFIYKDRGQSDRTVKALTWRIGLSILLILLVGAGLYFGIIEPSGPRINLQAQ